MPAVRRLPKPPVSNPFVHHVKWTLPLVAEMVLGAIFLLPLRILLVVFVVPTVTLIAFIASYGYDGEPNEHIQPWQRKLVKLSFRLLSRIGLFALGYNWVNTIGRKAPFSECRIAAVAPHTAWADGPGLVYAVLGRTMTRIENKYIMMQREVLMSLESIFIDRSAPGQGKILKTHLEAPGSYLPLTCCPEGTTHCGDGLLSFKIGIFRAGLPVQPVQFEIGPRDPGVSIWPYSGLGTLGGVLAGMCRFNNTFTVKYFPVYKPSAAEKADASLFAENFRQYMSRVSGKPALGYSLEDGAYTTAAMRLGLPDYSGAVQHHLISEAFGFRKAFIEKQLERFAEINVSKTGLVTVDEFCQYLCWPAAEDCKRFFQYYATDPDRKDRLTFAEFLVGLGDLTLALSKTHDTRQLETRAFSILSGDGDAITLDTVRQALPGAQDASEDSIWTLVSRFTASDTPSDAKGAFAAAMEQYPEYRVLMQWLVHGGNSYPDEDTTAVPSNQSDTVKQRRKGT